MAHGAQFYRFSIFGFPNDVILANSAKRHNGPKVAVGKVFPRGSYFSSKRNDWCDWLRVGPVRGAGAA